MKTAIGFLLLLLPLYSFAVPENCRFSKHAEESNDIQTKGCRDKICTHLLVCDKKTELVFCKSKNGFCDDYDALECFSATTGLSEDAEYNTGMDE